VEISYHIDQNLSRI